MTAIGRTVELRLVRSLLVAALTACASGLAHVLGGGHRAPVWLLLALTAVGTPLMYAVSGRRWRFSQLLFVMGLAQLALHGAMSTAMCASSGDEMSPGSTSLAHHVDPASLDRHTTTGWGMLAAHVAMTAFFALALAHGEKVLAWTLRVLTPRAGEPWYGEFVVDRHIYEPVPRPTLDVRSAPRASRAPPFAVVFALTTRQSV